jgi:lysophospholipase L1-like esterase
MLSMVTPSAFACPKVGKLPDFNCDGKQTIVALGDSFVFGIGDTENGNQGGYILRAQEAFPDATFVNLGKPGESTLGLLYTVRRSIEGTRSLRVAKALKEADLILIDIGRNDYWNQPPVIGIERNIQRVADLINEYVQRETGHAPLVVKTVLMHPKREAQATWITDLNRLIARSGTSSEPADLRFDSISTKLIGDDKLHPTSAGYSAMGTILTRYLESAYPRHATVLRPDLDHDGLYDMYEVPRFGTSPRRADTDGDGILDGRDPFPRRTPLTPTPEP